MMNALAMVSASLKAQQATGTGFSVLFLSDEYFTEGTPFPHHLKHSKPETEE